MSTPSEVLKEAWSAVEDAGLPEKIQEVAFREAVRLVAPLEARSMSPDRSGTASAGGSVTHGPELNGSGGPKNGGGDGAAGSITLSEKGLVQKVAAGTGADAEQLESLIHVDDGKLRVSLPGFKLGKNNADRTRAIAAIFTIVRSFGLDEDDTSVELVREEAQRLKCYDSANFSSQLKALQGFVTKGAGVNRRIQAKGPGISEFPNLVSKLAGDA